MTPPAKHSWGILVAAIVAGLGAVTVYVLVCFLVR